MKKIFFYFLFLLMSIISFSQNEIIIEKDSVDQLRDQIVQLANYYEGVPYRYGCENPEVGFDCSGFMKYIFSNYGVELPHSAEDISQLGQYVPFNQVCVGDLLFFGKILQGAYHVTHVALVSEIDEQGIKITHASSSRGVVQESTTESSWNYYWQKRFLFASNILNRFKFK